MAIKKPEKYSRVATICSIFVRQITEDQKTGFRKLGLAPGLVRELMGICDELGIHTWSQPLRIENANTGEVKEAVKRLIDGVTIKNRDKVIVCGKCYSASPYGDAAETIVRTLWNWIPESGNAETLRYAIEPRSLWHEFVVDAKKNLTEWQIEATELAKNCAVSTKRGGRKPIESEQAYLDSLNTLEREVIEMRDRKTAVEIDQIMKNRREFVEIDSETTLWEYGTAKGIIDKYKKWLKRHNSATKSNVAA